MPFTFSYDDNYNTERDFVASNEEVFLPVFRVGNKSLTFVFDGKIWPEIGAQSSFKGSDIILVSIVRAWVEKCKTPIGPKFKVQAPFNLGSFASKHMQTLIMYSVIESFQRTLFDWRSFLNSRHYICLFLPHRNS